MTFMAIWRRPFFYIYPVGLIGCLLAGFINGLGSVLYYTALGRINAGVGQLLYSLYPLFLAFWLLLDRQSITPLTALRLVISIVAVGLLLQSTEGTIDLFGAVMMVGSAALYALHLVINQRILFEGPAPTVTIYTLLGMSATVVIAYLLGDRRPPADGVAWWAIFSMALITFLSRFTLFLGIKRLGGLQTALLGLGEVLVTVILSSILLHERLTPHQWLGATLLCVSLVLVGLDRIPPQKRLATGWLSWLNPPSIPTTDVPWQSQP
jgi:drug/metabolite transporter (DMT)-like permease